MHEIVMGWHRCDTIVWKDQKILSLEFNNKHVEIDVENSTFMKQCGNTKTKLKIEVKIYEKEIARIMFGIIKLNNLVQALD